MEILNKYNYIIFDFDGTIVALDINWEKLKEELARTFKINFAILNEGLKKLTQQELNLAFDVIKKYELSAEYNVNSNIVNYIKKVNKNYAIFSDNMTCTILKILNELNIRSKFKIIIGKDSVKNFKPNTEGITKILNFFDIDSENVIFIGDSKKDELAAKNAKIKFVNISDLSEEQNV